jgi:hypothetical protein
MKASMHPAEARETGAHALYQRHQQQPGRRLHEKAHHQLLTLGK